MRHQIAALVLTTAITMPSLCQALEIDAVMDRVILMGAAYIRCPKGTVSDHSMAMGIGLVQQKTQAKPDHVFDVLMQAAQNVANTIDTEEKLADLCKTFSGVLP